MSNPEGEVLLKNFTPEGEVLFKKFIPDSECQYYSE